MIAFILVSKRDDEVALLRQWSIAQPRSDIAFNSIYDLGIERHIVVRKIDVASGKLSLREKDEPEKEKEPSPLHVR